MRDKFYGYYTPTNEEFSNLWESCLFVLDTNTLLNLYRYTEDTYRSFLKVLESLSDRIWIPYKVADEFHRNRISCIFDQQKAYSTTRDAYDKVFSEFSSKLNKYKQHKFIDTGACKERLKNFIEKEKKGIEKIEKKHPDFIKNDRVLKTLSKILKDKIGPEYSEEYLDTIYKEGETRYKNKIPPGYMDEDKSDSYRLYGDLIIWKDIIREGGKTQKPIIFVTSDNKEDWWLKFGGKDLGPRPELIQEFKHETGSPVYMYNPTRFIEYASKFLDQHTAETVLTEIENVRQTQYSSRQEPPSALWNFDTEDYKDNDERTDIRRQIATLVRKVNIYLEDKSVLQDKMNHLVQSIRNIDRLIENDENDEHLAELELKKDERTSKLVNYQYDLDRLEDRLLHSRRLVQRLEKDYHHILNRHNEVPF